MEKASVAVASGDGIGKEIMEATLNLLNKAGANLKIFQVEMGEKPYLKGFYSGIDPSAWEILKSVAAILKGPILIPDEKSYLSPSLQLQIALGLYTNVSRSLSYFPFIKTIHPEMDVAIFWEIDAGFFERFETKTTPNTASLTKTFSQAGAEKVIRYAFEYAKKHGRKKVTALAKDSLTKCPDELFLETFDEVKKEYPDILNETSPIDIGAGKLSASPEVFDVIVTPNSYGHILAHIAAKGAGSMGLRSVASMGKTQALFEPMHGAHIAQKNKNSVNPSGLFMAAVEMLCYIGQPEPALLIENAWLKTLEEGIHPYDLYNEETSKKKVGTKEFTEAVIAKLGKAPETLEATISQGKKVILPPSSLRQDSSPKRFLIGIDVFIYHKGQLSEFFSKISHINIGSLHLKLITNRGVQVFPETKAEIFLIDKWCCRFISDSEKTVSQDDVIKILHAFDHVRIDVIEAKFLYL